MQLLFVILIGILALVSGCSFTREEKKEKEKTEPGRLITFSYIYSNFRYRPFEFLIKRRTDDNGVERIYFTAEGYSDGLISVDVEIEEAVVDDLVMIMEEENIFSWDGFKKHNKEVRDGFSFELRGPCYQNDHVKPLF